MRQLYIDNNHKKRVTSVGNKGKGLLFKASCFNIRQVAVTYRRGTSVVRNLKFLTPFFNFQQSSLLTIITVPTRVVVTGELSCITNNNFALFNPTNIYKGVYA